MIIHRKKKSLPNLLANRLLITLQTTSITTHITVNFVCLFTHTKLTVMCHNFIKLADYKIVVLI